MAKNREIVIKCFLKNNNVYHVLITVQYAIGNIGTWYCSRRWVIFFHIASPLAMSTQLLRSLIDCQYYHGQ